MNAITVCVDYSDILAVTLPRNLRHFTKFTVVTSPADWKTRQVVNEAHNRDIACDLSVVVTNAFYRDGGVFRKWLALEEGLDCLGRDGWITVLDADIVLPSTMPFDKLEEGCLHSPWRRMLREPEKFSLWENDKTWEMLPAGPEGWNKEWAGYCSIFHGSDSVLGKPPWWDTSWTHAGGADSWFYRKWPEEKRKRLDCEVLHLGLDGQNWCGRVTPFLDGTVPAEAQERADKLNGFRAGRRQWGYAKEKV